MERYSWIANYRRWEVQCLSLSYKCIYVYRMRLVFHPLCLQHRGPDASPACTTSSSLTSTRWVQWNSTSAHHHLFKHAGKSPTVFNIAQRVGLCHVGMEDELCGWRIFVNHCRKRLADLHFKLFFHVKIWCMKTELLQEDVDMGRVWLWGYSHGFCHSTWTQVLLPHPLPVPKCDIHTFTFSSSNETCWLHSSHAVRWLKLNSSKQMDVCYHP